MRASHLRLELDFMECRGEPFHARDRGIPKGNTGFLASYKDALDTEAPPDDAKKCKREHRVGRRREGTEAITQLGANGLDLFRRLEAGKPFVDVELGLLRLDVVVGEIGRDV